MLLHFYALGLILLAALPAVMLTKNLTLFRKLPALNAESHSGRSGTVLVSVLIPARDEEQSIAECLRHVLACPALPSLQLEVIVMDDGSRDNTFAICADLAATDRRLRVLRGQALPEGWNGKQYACWQLSQAARGHWLLFIDADVRLVRDAIPRLVDAAESEAIDLLSGFPEQITLTFFERLLIPLMHFILLGYLPIARMRASRAPAYAAGCGQLFFARREAYELCQGHKAIAASRHDGVKLPRAFRKHGLKTDIFDATDLATCRMYHCAAQVFRGLIKNATEGIANPRTIVPFTILLCGAAVLPFLSFCAAIMGHWNSYVTVELGIALWLSYLPRVMAARRFDQSQLSAVLHPLGVAIFLAIQWLALFAKIIGVKIRWRGRA